MISDYLDMYKTISGFVNDTEQYNNYVKNNPIKLVTDLKSAFYECLLKYRNKIDILNFKEIYDEVKSNIYKNKFSIIE